MNKASLSNYSSSFGREISTLEAEIEQYVQRIEQAQQAHQVNKKPAANVKNRNTGFIIRAEKLKPACCVNKVQKQNQDTLRLMQALELTEQGKPHAQIIEKFLAKWLQAHIVETEQAFQEGVARQLKPSEQSSKI